jgi:hypothetical protein
MRFAPFDETNEFHCGRPNSFNEKILGYPGFDLAELRWGEVMVEENNPRAHWH